MVTSSYSNAGLNQRIKQLEYENHTLREEITNRNLYDASMLALFVEISRKLQASSASIKAAISSLLNHDILWAGSTQQEFLETIDLSANQIGDLILLISLIFRFESGGMELKQEPQVIVEILANVSDYLAKSLQGIRINLQIPNDGKLVFIDYEYSIIAIKLIFDSLLESFDRDRDIRIEAVENQDSWYVDIFGFRTNTLVMVDQFLHFERGSSTDEMSLSAENRLKAFLAGRILRLQHIQSQKVIHSNADVYLRLIIPAANIE